MAESLDDFKVAALWDINTCPVGQKANLDTLKDDITRALNNWDVRMVITVAVVCGDLTARLSRVQQQSLRSQGFTLRQGTERKPRCFPCKQKNNGSAPKQDLSPDLFIKSYMLGETLIKNLPHNILLISGDRDFEDALSYLKHRKLIILGESAGTDPAFRTHGHVGYLWENLQTGGHLTWTNRERNRVGAIVVPWGWKG